MITPSHCFLQPLQLHLPVFIIELFGNVGCIVLFFWIPSTIYLLVAYLFPKQARRFKTQSSEPLPTPRVLRACAIVVLRNQLLGLALQIGTHVFFTALLRTTPYAVIPTSPSALRIACEVLFCVPLCEMSFYTFHRLLHHPYLYRRIHKMHHLFTAPISLAAQYAHPVEFLLTCHVPIMFPPLILRAHILSMWLFSSVVLFESCSVHSGYRLGKLAERHDKHHAYSAQGGYGTFEVLDRLLGTEMKRAREGGRGVARP